MHAYKYTPLGFASTAVGTATAGTLTLPSGKYEHDIKLTLIHFSGAAVFRDDGTAPIAETAGTSGYPVVAGADLNYEANPSKLKFIGQSGSVTVSYSFYG